MDEFRLGLLVVALASCSLGGVVLFGLALDRAVRQRDALHAMLRRWDELENELENEPAVIDSTEEGERTVAPERTRPSECSRDSRARRTS